MKITFWGTRGSIPSPGLHTVRYGGNTPCIEIRLDDNSLIILDAGTGIRMLGDKLLAEGNPINAALLITHQHWDHIQGLPFFKPAFIGGNKFMVIGSSVRGISLKRALSNQTKRMYFPVRLKEMEATFTFRSVKEEQFEVFGATVNTIYVNHPVFALGYRIHHRGCSVVYISDNEPVDSQTIAQMSSKRSIIQSYINHGNDLNQKLYDFCRGADLLIHDSFFTPDEYVQHIGWGHSHYLFTLQVAREAKVKHCVFFHHHPERKDEEIDDMVQICKREIERTNIAMECSAAIEGQTIVL
ncbi:MAG: MBL fold metallo-hydrolase [Ignavibacteria bacterium]|nr:MBL fold metallo-hydrolase [Ignavibacteria bacterium]